MADALAPGLAERYGVPEGLIKPSPGFRAGAGYQWRHWRFSLESGYTYIRGDNPLVLDIALIPLELKAGYVFSPWKNFSIIPLLGAGFTFASVNHYETALDMLMENKTHSADRSLVAGAALRLGWSFLPALTLYAGAGVDCIIESGGLIPLPALELGITVKPFLFGKKREAAAKSRGTEPVAAVSAVAEAAAIEAAAAEIAAAETAGPERVVLTLYFPPERAVPVRPRPAELDAAGELLRSDPELRVTLRGYSAPHGTEAGRRSLSEARARFCENYLVREWGIPQERITVERYEDGRLPEGDDGSDPRRRCTEIIIEG
jgi:hypothetical protein